MLSAKSLSSIRDGKLLFSNINFEIDSGSVLFVKGRNGIGKSTLLRMIAGFIPIEEGQIHFNNSDITNKTDEIALTIGYFGHLGAIKEQLTVEENMSFWNYLYSGSNKLPEDSFQLNDIKSKLVSNCSAGQKRKLSLSRLLSTQKKVWLLDEPTTSLDQNSISILLNLIKNHCKNGGIAVVVSHLQISIPNIKQLEILEPYKRDIETTNINDPFLAGTW